MEVIPAVDIRGSRCVRLYQGDYRRETVFSEDAVAAAVSWADQGASRLHVVDLDGAAAGEPRNLAVVEAILRRVSIPVQLGGGIRDEVVVARLLEAGVSRVVLGTAAVENPGLIQKLCQQYGEAIVVGIDARDGQVVTHGWLRAGGVTALELGRRMAELGARRLIYTDVRRDGTLTEPAFEAIAEMVRSVGLPLIAAGGISKLDHLSRLKELGVEGAIVGRALYSGDIDLKAALAVMR
ncbi:MAG TPA: 1-(5-phosphoribosyl)-5-[(5-phosphoribosylamino)methylideneamino]imidazole-4-carboxamide isomerase [Dehalococcoidia bacterium]|nr:1-(5-phosphoribosyl)-5-[(5-phosphoribosylamino)methylideneamino]imidazole-4-carboxamide isomerase [Dehalococcoidia bacterium]